MKLIATLNPFLAWLEATPVAHAVGQSLLLTASLSAVYHFTVLRRVARTGTARPALLRSVGAAGLSLWFGLGFAGAAFTLFE